MTLTGILKNIILVLVSVLIWTTQITALQVLGYTIALGGLVYYSLGWNTIAEKATEFSTWLGAATGTSGSYTLLEGANPSPAVRKSLVVGLVAAGTATVVVGLYYSKVQA